METNSFVRQVSVDLFENTDKVIITINDNGVGIKKSIISKIFNPFFTTKSEKSGTGLGLSISYGIISEMKGTIEVESAEEKYTKVIVMLPKK
ncbi:MAG: hypothetical protein DRJ01_14770 [Bacteroidetes bacterium]|nr:MAG: hypothetical protein DRJ01_14770 [Bacteroidota bacterium]